MSTKDLEIENQALKSNLASAVDANKKRQEKIDLLIDTMESIACDSVPECVTNKIDAVLEKIEEIDSH